MTSILKGIGFLAFGFLFGLVVDFVGYSLVEDIVCAPSHPNTCFITQHAAFRPLVYGILCCIPVATALAFVLLLSSGRMERAAQIFFAVLVGTIIVLALAKAFHRSSVTIGMGPNQAIESAPGGRPTRKSDALLLAAHL